MKYLYLFIPSFIIMPAICTQNHTSQGDLQFPVLFKMENYYECPNNTIFCSASCRLIPKDANNAYYKKLEEYSQSRKHFNRTVIYRTLCVPNETLENTEDRRLFVENNANYEMAPYNISSRMFHLICLKPDLWKTDKSFYVKILMYLSVIVIATIYDETFYDRKRPTILENILVCFSLTNYKKTSITKSVDYRRLKCMQGIRTYQQIMVIMGHVFMTLNQKYISNPEFVEEYYQKRVIQYLLVGGMCVLQTYFFISTWLLTYQIFSIHKQTGQFTIRQAGLIMVHRAARIWPVVAVMIFIGLPIFRQIGYGPGSFELITLIGNACPKYWWVTFLSATNFLKTYDMCHQGLWSLSVDSQLYLLNIIFLYIVINYKLSFKKCLAVLFVIYYIVNVLMIYHLELGLDSWVNVKLTTNINYFTDEKITYIYLGFWANASSCIVGMFFGYYFFFNKENDDKPEPYEKYYSTIFAGLPLLSIIVGSTEYPRLANALIGPLIKPIFSFGIATGLYGLSRNVIRGYVKQVCENKYAVQLANFTFSTYLFHFFVVFGNNANSGTILKLTVFKFVRVTVESVIASFLLGIIVTLAVELPGVYLKKLVLPPLWLKATSAEEVIHDTMKSRSKKL